MRNLINYYYKLEPEDIHHSGNYYTFNIEKDFYRLQDIKDISVETVYDLVLELYQKGIYTHQILRTITNEFSVIFNQKRYVLLKYMDGENKGLSLENIYYFQNFLYSISVEKAMNTSKWGDLWSQKIDYFEYQMNQFGVKYPVIRDSFAYYIGLAEVGISLFYTYYSQDETLVLAHKRLKANSSLYDLYDPFNLIVDSKVRDIAEYFKFLYLEGEDIYPKIREYLQNKNLSNYDKIMFLIRMFYPSFYFDMYEHIIDNQLDDEPLKEIIKKTKNYDHILKFIYNELTMTMNLPYISWLKKI